MRMDLCPENPNQISKDWFNISVYIVLRRNILKQNQVAVIMSTDSRVSSTSLGAFSEKAVIEGKLSKASK